MKIVDFSLKKKVTMSMVVLVIVILGMISFTKLGLDMLPDMDYPFITVVTTYSGVSSEDIEQNITRPVEQWVSTVSGIKDLKSISLEGQSVVMIEFEWGINLDFAAQDVRDAIGLYEQFLPKGSQKPFVMKFNFSQMPIIAYGITGGDMSLSKLRDYIDNEVATRLERIEGVASASVFSPEMNEVVVRVDKGKLESRDLNIGQVEMAIQASNINLPAGYMTENHKEYLLRSMGEFKAISEIDDVLIGISRTGSPIFLKDIGTVSEEPKEARLKLRMNGQPGIMMMLTKSSGANSVLVARQAKKVLAGIEPTLKQGVKFHVWLDMSRIIEMMTNKRDHQHPRGRHPGHAAHLPLPAQPQAHAGHRHHHPAVDRRDLHRFLYDGVYPEPDHPGRTGLGGGHAGRQCRGGHREHLPPPAGGQDARPKRRAGRHIGGRHGHHRLHPDHRGRLLPHGVRHRHRRPPGAEPGRLGDHRPDGVAVRGPDHRPHAGRLDVPRPARKREPDGRAESSTWARTSSPRCATATKAGCARPWSREKRS